MYYYCLCVNFTNRPFFTIHWSAKLYDMAVLLQFAKPPVVSYSSLVMLTPAVTAMALSSNSKPFFPLTNLPHLFTHLQSHHDVINEKGQRLDGFDSGNNFCFPLSPLYNHPFHYRPFSLDKICFTPSITIMSLFTDFCSHWQAEVRRWRRWGQQES